MSLMADGSGVDLILDTTPVVTFTSIGGSTNAATKIVNGTVDVSVDPEAIGTPSGKEACSSSSQRYSALVFTR